jgi:hypothetical protein
VNIQGRTVYLLELMNGVLSAMIVHLVVFWVLALSDIKCSFVGQDRKQRRKANGKEEEQIKEMKM